MYIRGKQIKGHTYYYLVKSERHGKRVVQKVIRYLGNGGELTWAISTGNVRKRRTLKGKTPIGLGAIAREARKYKNSEEFVQKMREGVVLEGKRLPDILRSPMADLWEARRKGTFDDTERTKKLVWENIHALNRELQGKPFGPLYRLNAFGKIELAASDITTMTKGIYEPKILGKKVSVIQPEEINELITKIKEQIKQRAIDPLVGKERIQLLKELQTGRTLTDFYREVWQQKDN